MTPNSLATTPCILIVHPQGLGQLAIHTEILALWPGAKVLFTHEADELQQILVTYKPDTLICSDTVDNLPMARVLNIVHHVLPKTDVIAWTDKPNQEPSPIGVLGVVSHEDPKKLAQHLLEAQRRHHIRTQLRTLLKAHIQPMFFEPLSGFLNREGFIHVCNEVFTNLDPNKQLTVLVLRLPKQFSVQLERDPRVKRNTLEKLFQRIRQTFLHDTLCKWSDQLVAVLTDQIDWQQNQNSILATLMSLHAQLNLPLMTGAFPIRPDISLGLARPGQDAYHPADLVTHGQWIAQLMERHNLRIESILQEETHALAKRRKKIELSLAHGIEFNELHLEFQMVENLQTQKVEGLEALVRWNHPELGRIMPDEFIGVAEDSGLMNALGAWVLNNTCLALHHLHNKGFKLRCAVNCSPGQLNNPEFIHFVAKTLERHQIAPQYLELEITESTAMQDIQTTRNVLIDLQALGCNIALDDFGTGFASINCLRELPVNVLKIDKGLVTDCLDNPQHHCIIRAIVELAHALGMTSHAEGIETLNQRHALAHIGCQRGQGYWLNQPLGLSALLGTLEHRD